MNQARSFPGLDLHLSLDILSFTDVMIRETGEPVKGVRFEIEVPEGESSFKNLPEHLALPTNVRLRSRLHPTAVHPKG